MWFPFDPKHVPNPTENDLRAEVERLSAERAGLIEEIASKDDYIRLLEDEVDALRHALGCAEVPL